MFEVLLPSVLGPGFVEPGFRYSAEGMGGVAAASLKPMMRHTVGTQHGRILTMLGHAAEHLASSRRFVFEESEESTDDDEAIHILMSLSRDVFEEYAASFQEGGDEGDFDMGLRDLFARN